MFFGGQNSSGSTGSSSSSTPSVSATALLEAASRHFEAGRVKEAEEYLSRVLSLKTALRDEIIQAFLLRGSVRMQAGKPVQAVSDWKVVLQMEPGHEEAASLLFGEGNVGVMPFIDGAILRQDTRLAHRRSYSGGPISPPASPTSSTAYGDRDPPSRRVSINGVMLPAVTGDDESDTFSLHSSGVPGASPRLFSSPQSSALAFPIYLTGRIRVQNYKSKTVMGFVAFKEQSYCLVSNRKSAAITVSATLTAPPFDLTIISPDLEYPCLGFVNASLPDKQSYSIMSRTVQTPAKVPAAAVGNLVNKSAKCESCVWSFDNVTRQLTPTLHTAEGTKRDNLVGYSYHHRALCVPADFLRYKAVVNDLVRVELFLA